MAKWPNAGQHARIPLRTATAELILRKFDTEIAYNHPMKHAHLLQPLILLISGLYLSTRIRKEKETNKTDKIGEMVKEFLGDTNDYIREITEIL